MSVLTEMRPMRTLPQLVADYERVIIIRTIQACGGSRTLAARSLGVKRRHLYTRIAQLKIDLRQLPARVGRPPKEVLSCE